MKEEEEAPRPARAQCELVSIVLGSCKTKLVQYFRSCNLSLDFEQLIETFVGWWQPREISCPLQKPSSHKKCKVSQRRRLFYSTTYEEQGLLKNRIIVFFHFVSKGPFKDIYHS